MPPKRASVPSNAFGASPSALDKLTGRAPADDVGQQNRDTVKPENSNTVKTQDSDTADMQDLADDSSTREKLSFYLRPDQIDKLDEMVLSYKRRTGKRTNRNALMSQILDRVDLDFILGE